MLKRILFLSLYLCLLPETAVADNNITVYAPASMTNAVNEITERFFDNTAIKVIAVYGGSSSLARQIDNGAPADIYISANTKWMNYLLEQGVILGDAVTNIAANELVLIAPAVAETTKFDLSDQRQWVQRLQTQRLALGQTESVPAGIYARQSLENLGVWPVIKARTASTHSVRGALTLVERGEAHYGIVYKTDAMISNKVKVVGQFAAESHDPIIYPLVVINDRPEVQALADYFNSEEAREIFKRYGFRMAGEQ